MITKNNIKTAVRILKRGGVVVYPTDTAYALGCDATNARAVRRIFIIKQRNKRNALPMIVSDIAMAKKFFVLLPTHYPLLTKHWPGPLSIILKAKPIMVRSALKSGTAAVRVPDSRVARALAAGLNRPLIATSANLSGKPTAYSIRVLTVGADVVLNAGTLPRRKLSTIVHVAKNGTIEILREGPIKL